MSRSCLSFSPAALRSATALKLQLSFSHSSKRTLYFCLPSSFAWWLNNRCHVKRAVKALPECLCQQQRPGWAVQPAHHAGKRERTRRKSSLFTPQMTPAGSHRLLDSAGRLSPPHPRFISRGPRTPIFRHSHIGLFCMVGPKQLPSAEKKVTTTKLWNK